VKVRSSNKVSLFVRGRVQGFFRTYFERIAQEIKTEDDASPSPSKRVRTIGGSEVTVARTADLSERSI